LLASPTYVNSVAWSPDGKRLATVSDDITVKVWDVDSGKDVLTLRGQTRDVLDVAWSPDGKRLATSDDSTVKLWNAASRQEVMLRDHTRVWSLSWSPDGKSLATGEEGGTVRIYVIDIHELVSLARTRVIRALTPDECLRYFQSKTCPPLP
jgi:eukaryotic-like serine/threonine-protein kinase